MILKNRRDERTDIVILFLRLVLGAFLFFHGVEVFEESKMREYATWVSGIQFFSPATVSYIGKFAELITGIMLILGLGTRVAAGLVILTFLFITFKLGEGRIFMQEQHPFMFVLFGLLFLVEGGRRWSLDFYINNLRRRRHP